jgi:hypothetical protein
VNEQPSIETVNELLDIALSAPADQRTEALAKLAEAVANANVLIAGDVAEKLNAANVVDQRIFRKAVRGAMKRQPKVTGSISFQQSVPSDAELAKRWIAAHPQIALEFLQQLNMDGSPTVK